MLAAVVFINRVCCCYAWLVLYRGEWKKNRFFLKCEKILFSELSMDSTIGNERIQQFAILSVFPLDHGRW